jgi:hypothetical protein
LGAIDGNRYEASDHAGVHVGAPTHRPSSDSRGIYLDNPEHVIQE